jgi:inorganic pyrophosphatase
MADDGFWRHAMSSVKTAKATDQDSSCVPVVIETPKGSRNKFCHDSKTGQFELSKVLPRGMTFPFDFGFIPGTRAEDGDPLDVLVLMDEPAFTGCRVRCRIIGVVEGEQITKRGSCRNDRLIAVAEECREDGCIQTIKDVPDELVKEIEHFFVTYHDLDGKSFKVIARRGPKQAEKLVRKAIKRFRKKQ